MTAFGLLGFIAVLMVGGYAIDVGNAVTARTQLQAATDSAAHAALMTREFHSEADSKQAGVTIAEDNMPPSVFGYVIDPSDITFGKWDLNSETFTPVAGSTEAVRVIAHRNETRANAVRTYLLGLVGLKDWNLITGSIYRTYYPTCLMEGFVAEGVVDVQSNNTYQNGFCIHSNTYVSINSNNTFEPGTVVSMPDLSLLDLPNSGFKTNDGLQDALRQGSWNIRILSRIQGIIDGLKSFDPHYSRDYISSNSIVTLTGKKVTQADLVPGHIHVATCGSGGGHLTIDNNVDMGDVVLLTDCKIQFNQGVVVHDAVIATTSTSAKSMVASSGLQVGLNDNCAPGGGAQLLTLGSMDFPSDLKIYGSQLLAQYDVSFSANANGIQGAAIVAGGEISGTSNMDMGFCGTGMEHNFEAAYFKLAL
ncbi:pilus assembly protein TadG-related protein [Acidimangrovimonas pyrenivorans]|uniref:Pilus assembly protein TadG-related protein n=1 Tax=Acidimangrovimonas pyrenivorans TaxID=2030798 RepID=A0ABV7AG62_9RHOB